MLDELTSEQQFELFLYHATEPFGEVREDLRMAKMLQFYYEGKRGKRGRKIPLGDFAMYADLSEDRSGERASETDLLKALGGNG